MQVRPPPTNYTHLPSRFSIPPVGTFTAHAFAASDVAIDVKTSHGTDEKAAMLRFEGDWDLIQLNLF